jgi:hypothetical protein
MSHQSRQKSYQNSPPRKQGGKKKEKEKQNKTKKGEAKRESARPIPVHHFASSHMYFIISCINQPR